MFAALGDPTRRDLYLALARDGEATATDLASRRSITRQAVSKHLGLLEGAGLAASTRRGREVLFRAEPAPLADVANWLRTTGDAWERRLGALDALLGDTGPSGETPEIR